MNKLRCWPGCRAQVVYGYPTENIGKVIVVTELMEGSDSLWEFSGSDLNGHLGTKAHFVADDCLIPLDPPEGSITDSEVRDLYEPKPIKEVA